MPSMSLYTQVGVMEMNIVMASQCACDCGECGPQIAEWVQQARKEELEQCFQYGGLEQYMEGSDPSDVDNSGNGKTGTSNRTNRSSHFEEELFATFYQPVITADHKQQKLKAVEVSFLLKLLYNRIWTWQGRTHVAAQLAAHSGKLVWDSDDAEYDDDAVRFALFGERQYASAKARDSLKKRQTVLKHRLNHSVAFRPVLQQLLHDLHYFDQATPSGLVRKTYAQIQPWRLCTCNHCNQCKNRVVSGEYQSRLHQWCESCTELACECACNPQADLFFRQRLEMSQP